MIQKMVEKLIMQYSNKPVIMYLRYLKDGQEFPVNFVSPYEMTVSASPTEHRIELVLKGTSFVSFDVGEWKGGTFKAIVVGKGGYMPKEDMPKWEISR